MSSVGGWLEEMHGENRLSLREQSDRRMGGVVFAEVTGMRITELNSFFYTGAFLKGEASGKDSKDLSFQLRPPSML